MSFDGQKEEKKFYTFGKFESGKRLEELALEYGQAIGPIQKILVSATKDIQLLKQRFHDVPDFQQRMLSIYLQSIPDRLSQIDSRLHSFIRNYLHAESGELTK